MVYQGSKSRVAKDICPIIQKAIDESNCDTFVDAFVGGANLIQHIKCENRIGYDINPYLIALLNNLDKIPNFEVPISKEEYDICRAEWRSAQLTHPDWYIGAVGYIASFGGRFQMVDMQKTSLQVIQSDMNIAIERTTFLNRCRN